MATSFSNKTKSGFREPLGRASDPGAPGSGPSPASRVSHVATTTTVLLAACPATQASLFRGPPLFPLTQVPCLTPPRLQVGPPHFRRVLPSQSAMWLLQTQPGKEGLYGPRVRPQPGSRAPPSWHQVCPGKWLRSGIEVRKGLGKSRLEMRGVALLAVGQ